VDEERGRHTVSVLCRVLKVTRAGYYAWKKRKPSSRRSRDTQLKKDIMKVYRENRSIYGAPRIEKALRAAGIGTSRRRCARLMAELGIRGVLKTKKYPGSRTKPEQAPSQDLVHRHFVASELNKLWCADITYVATWQGTLYLAVVFDTCSRKIVGWSMDVTMTADLVDDALKMAIWRRNPDAGLIHHSDKGGQYRSILLGATMRAHGIRPSMGAVAAPGDNAITESLMSTIKAECVHRQTYKTKEEAKIDIFDYIECFYNRLRLHSGIGYMSPNDYEATMETGRKAAA